MERSLVLKCIDSATQSAADVEMWRRQRRTLALMPSLLAEALFRQLLRRRLVFPALLEVFKYSIEEMDLSGESCVDAEWMAYLGAYHSLRSLLLADCYKITNSAIWNLSGMENLKVLELSRCSKLTDAGIKHLLSIPTIEKLCITGTAVTAEGVTSLASLTNLKFLDLGGLPVTDLALSAFQALSKLEHLDICGCKVSNSGVAHLMMLPSLSFLNLCWTNVTHLPNLPSLVSLDMSNCTLHSLFEGEQKYYLEKVILSGANVNISKVFQQVDTSRLSFLDLSGTSIESFSFLSSMKSLEDLNLSDCQLRDVSMQHIAAIGPSLRHLNLKRTRITSDGVRHIAGKLPNLETLLLMGTEVDHTAVPYISVMTSLKAVDLSRTNVTGIAPVEGTGPDEDSSLSALQNLRNLERLYLEDINGIDAAVSSLKNLCKLSHLFLRGLWLTDVSLHKISCFPNLVHVTLREAVLTDAGLLSFVPPPAMEVIDLKGCWLLSHDALMHFHRKHSQIELRHAFLEEEDKRNFCWLSPSRVHNGSPKRNLKYDKPLRLPLSLNGIFLDQRLKYSREELLSLQYL